MPGQTGCIANSQSLPHCTKIRRAATCAAAPTVRHGAGRDVGTGPEIARSPGERLKSPRRRPGAHKRKVAP